MRGYDPEFSVFIRLELRRTGAPDTATCAFPGFGRDFPPGLKKHPLKYGDQ